MLIAEVVSRLLLIRQPGLLALDLVNAQTPYNGCFTMRRLQPRSRQSSTPGTAAPPAAELNKRCLQPQMWQRSFFLECVERSNLH